MPAIDLASCPMSSSHLLNSSAVAIGARAILIEGKPGSGKSSLALALIDRGASLIGDDGVTLNRDGGQVMASPPPIITGKLEIRHVGIVELACTSAPLALIVELTNRSGEAIVRLPDPPKMREVLGIPVPLITLPAHDPQLALRVIWALNLLDRSLC